MTHYSSYCFSLVHCFKVILLLLLLALFEVFLTELEFAVKGSLFLGILPSRNPKTIVRLLMLQSGERGRQKLRKGDATLCTGIMVCVVPSKLCFLCCISKLCCRVSAACLCFSIAEFEPSYSYYRCRHRRCRQRSEHCGN